MTVKSAIEGYLAILTLAEGDETQRIKTLVRSLDELALASHTQDYPIDQRNYPDPPKKEDYNLRHNKIGKLFPSLGFYNSAPDVYESVGQTPLAIGDAIDDIVDIAGDLEEVLWRFDNTSEQDALYHFHFMFRAHWGRHLRELQLCLHDFLTK